jgi:aminoglycoside phosphotransferase (APT) family kinase protein
MGNDNVNLKLTAQTAATAAQSRLKVSEVPVGIVCVSYSDFLRHTLPQTLRGFSDVTIITAEQDQGTIRIAKTLGAKVFVSDLWFQNGAAFNKSAAINQWLSSQPLAWTLILDADIYLPDAFQLDVAELNPQYLYSIPRRICELEWDWVCPENQRREYPLAIPPVRNGRVWRRPTSQPAALSGYFHLWNRGTAGQPFYPPSPNAAEYDVEFALQFPEAQRHYLLGDVIHLGPVKQNWSGRVSKPWTLVPEDTTLLPSELLAYGASHIYRFNLVSRNPTYLCTSLNQAWVYRTVPPGSAWQVAKETYIQQTLKAVPTPKVLAVLDTSYIMEYGGRASEGMANLPNSFFASCGTTLRRLHDENLDIPSLCQDRYAKANWDAMFGYHYRMAQCTRWLQRIPPQSPVVPWLKPLLARMSNDPALLGAFRASRFCFTHGDFRTRNILTDGAQVTNVIDFEHSIYGDPDSDLHTFCQRILLEGHPVEALRTFLSTYGASDTFHAKRRFYRYCQAFLHCLLRPPQRHDLTLTEWVKAIHDDTDPYLQCNLP